MQCIYIYMHICILKKIFAGINFAHSLKNVLDKNVHIKNIFLAEVWLYTDHRSKEIYFIFASCD